MRRRFIRQRGELETVRRHLGRKPYRQQALLAIERAERMSGLSRPSTSWLRKKKTWMPGTSPGMTNTGPVHAI
jgi:hypothetical protein